MSRRNRSRLVLAAVLASSLALAGPAHAQKAALARTDAAWEWLTNLWEKGISTLSSWTAADTGQGVGTTPDGGTTQSGGTTPGDAGPGFDPNGNPNG